MTFIKGDKELEHVLSVKHKSLRVNLNEHIYGTFAEIGAGQETVRHFSEPEEHRVPLQKLCQLMTKTFQTPSME